MIMAAVGTDPQHLIGRISRGGLSGFAPEIRGTLLYGTEADSQFNSDLFVAFPRDNQLRYFVFAQCNQWNSHGPVVPVTVLDGEDSIREPLTFSTAVTSQQ